jgi:hypothetical protein
MSGQFESVPAQDERDLFGTEKAAIRFCEQRGIDDDSPYRDRALDAFTSGAAWQRSEKAAPIAQTAPQKYDDVLLPFLSMMRAELHANAGKGDRPGWLAMDVKTALLEIFYHIGKLQKAAKKGDRDGIREYSADVANMSMMLADICGALPGYQAQTAPQPELVMPVALGPVSADYDRGWADHAAEVRRLNAELLPSTPC